MLVSRTVDHRSFLGDVRAVVVDEVHAFAGDDRGWHLLAVLERLAVVAGRDLQRVGLSATVGNPAELLRWLQGSAAGRRPASLIAPDDRPTALDDRRPGARAEDGAAPPSAAPPGDVEVDYVGSVHNAAKVIGLLHRGAKRLVFCDSKKLVEELGQALRAAGVTTYLSHASLSADERRRSEQAFAESRDCVIVATSTLELGIDVGDLDHVIQINAPGTVASFLQRLGRTGRRPGSRRNCLFLTLDDDGLARAAALLLLWARNWVEPVVPPPEPRHIVAQQVLALTLQEGRVGDRLWASGWRGLPPFDRTAEPIVRYLADAGFLDVDDGMLFIGTEAQRRFGFRHFSDLLAVFTAAPQFTVFAGRQEIGSTDPALLSDQVDGPRLLLLAGRSWRVNHIDWNRRRCFVEPVDTTGGRARWLVAPSAGAGALSFPLMHAVRDVLLGADPPVKTTSRAAERLARLREEYLDRVHLGGTVIRRERTGDVHWWTWAGRRANATLIATLGDLAERLCLPEVDGEALAGLKFNAALPPRLAEATLAARLADLDAAAVLSDPVRFVVR